MFLCFSGFLWIGMFFYLPNFEAKNGFGKITSLSFWGVLRFCRLSCTFRCRFTFTTMVLLLGMTTPFKIREWFTLLILLLIQLSHKLHNIILIQEPNMQLNQGGQFATGSAETLHSYIFVSVCLLYCSVILVSEWTWTRGFPGLDVLVPPVVLTSSCN